MVDKLDLLGVQYDVELEKKAKYELAERISDYWKVNCTDDDFYDNCIENIMMELGERGTDENNCVSDEVYEIWDIIEENYLE